MDRRYFVVQQYHVYVQDILVTLVDWPPVDAEVMKVAAIQDAVHYRGSEVGKPEFLEVLEDHGMSVEDEAKVSPELRDALEEAGDLLDRQQQFVQGIHDVREISAEEANDILDRDNVSIPRLLSRLTLKQRVALHLLHMNASLYGLDLVKLSNGALARGSVYVHLCKLEDQDLVEGEWDPRPEIPESVRRKYRLTDLGKAVVKSFDGLDLDEIQDVIETPSWFVRKWQDFRFWLSLQ